MAVAAPEAPTSAQPTTPEQADQMVAQTVNMPTETTPTEPAVIKQAQEVAAAAQSPTATPEASAAAPAYPTTEQQADEMVAQAVESVTPPTAPTEPAPAPGGTNTPEEAGTPETTPVAADATPTVSPEAEKYAVPTKPNPPFWKQVLSHMNIFKRKKAAPPPAPGVTQADYLSNGLGAHSGVRDQKPGNSGEPFNYGPQVAANTEAAQPADPAQPPQPAA